METTVLGSRTEIVVVTGQRGLDRRQNIVTEKNGLTVTVSNETVESVCSNGLAVTQDRSDLTSYGLSGSTPTENTAYVGCGRSQHSPA